MSLQAGVHESGVKQVFKKKQVYMPRSRAPTIGICQNSDTQEAPKFQDQAQTRLFSGIRCFTFCVPGLR